MGSLDKQNVLVVGGTSGIGLATAIAAQAEGAQVWAVSRSKERVKACQAAHPEIQFSPLDIHAAEGLAALFQQLGTIIGTGVGTGTGTGRGTMDHIVAAATGAHRTMAPFMEQSDAQFRAAFDKFWGYTNLARQGVPHLSEQGSLTFVTGTPARKCNPGMASISCTGCALEGLSRALALELAPKRVNVVAPGIVDTGLFDHFGDQKSAILDKMGACLPLGRVGKAEEVASAILFLMSNPYVTGTTIDVDGGALLP